MRSGLLTKGCTKVSRPTFAGYLAWQDPGIRTRKEESRPCDQKADCRSVRFPHDCPSPQALLSLSIHHCAFFFLSSPSSAVEGIPCRSHCSSLNPFSRGWLILSLNSSRDNAGLIFVLTRNFCVLLKRWKAAWISFIKPKMWRRINSVISNQDEHKQT